MHIRFGTDGLRGLANRGLTVETALALGRAAARVFSGSEVVIGRDTRRSGPMFEHVVAAGVCAEGADAVLLGVVPTPAVAAASARRNATGIMISASHNPFEDNGLKIFAPGGRKLTDSEQDSVEQGIAELLESVPHTGPTGAEVGVVRHEPALLDEYVAEVAAVLEGRTLEGLSIVVDSANGSNSAIAEKLLGDLGAQVESIGDSPDGININDGCGSTDIDMLAATVVASGADMGIAFDGDADRLIAVDHNGTTVNGDQIIALCAVDLARRERLASNTVVVTVMSNLGFLQAMKRAGIEVAQTSVGDRYVVEELTRGGYSLGGEQSGHIIFSDVTTTGDGMLAAIVLLDLVKRSGRGLSELAADSMTVLPQVLVNVRIGSSSADEVVRSVASEIGAAGDALGEDGRVLVRPSGTEPLVRVMVEATDDELAQQVANTLADQIRAAAGS